MIKTIKYITILSTVFLFVNVRAQINELHMVPDSGRSGYPISISYTINNTDQFVAFQFDVILPSVLTYIQDSVWLYRTTDHFVIANQVDPQTLRIVAFSPTNQPFTGNGGEIVSILFDLNGSTGTYNVGLSNVTISNAIGTNILTGYYPGFIKITSPDISGENNLDFGEVSVLDTVSYGYQLYNTGNDTLFVTDFYSSETYFWVDTPLPVNIPPYDSATFNLQFHNIIKGQYSATYTIVSNDPDENPFYVDAAATSFAPNYIIVENAEAYVRDTVTLKIDVDNYEQFYNFQVDLDFPDSLFYVPNSAALTNRKQDHTIHESLLSANTIRLFTFSPGQLPFLGDTGTVATLDFVVGNDTGTFPLDLSGGILTDSISQNIIRGTIDGEIYVQKRPTFQLSVNVNNGWNMVSVPGFNPDGMGIDSWWSGRDPGANVFQYFSGYQTVTSNTPQVGYWMKHLGNNTYNTGDEWPAEGIESVVHYPINASEGWNLIGGYEDTVQTSELTTTPPGLIAGPAYIYTGGYIIVTELLPGSGYWLKLSATGYINFPNGVSNKNKQLKEFFKENWGKIIITDNSGISYTLYAVYGEVNLDQYELPPMPPAGMFDIRYGSGRIAEDINNSIQEIQMSGVAYPLTVKVEGMDITVMDGTGMIVNVNLKSGEEVVISDATIQKLMVTGELVPAEYALEQNYPNPFNPSTTIEFSLPEDVSNVKLSIYNALGEKVAELVNGLLVAGKYQYQWNAKNVATGMYIYELRTDRFVSIKKMLLLK